MNTVAPSVQQMLAMRKAILQKRAFVPSQPTTAAAGGGAPPGVDPAAAGGTPPPGMDPAAGGGMPPGGGMDPSMMGGAPPPMDPSMGGAPGGGMDPSAMVAPDGTSPVPPGGAGGGAGGGKGGGGVKVAPEDIVVLQSQQARILAEMKMIRDLILDLFKQMNINVSPDTLRGSAANMGEIADPQSALQMGGGGGM